MDPIILIFIAVITTIIGFILGFLVHTLISRGTKKAKAPKQKKPTRTTKAPRRNWTEIAHLWRDSKDERLIFQIENQYYKRGDELTSREREILLKVVMDFYRWLEPPSAKQIQSSGSEMSEGSYESNPEVIPTPSSSSSEIRHDISPEEIINSTTETQPSAGIVGSFLSASITTPEPPSPSMVSQVNDILQEKLEAANMQKWAVRLTESPSKGMIVWVGMEKYEAIDEVPYKRVRTIIRASVDEWEQRTESGDTIQ